MMGLDAMYATVVVIIVLGHVDFQQEGIHLNVLIVKKTLDMGQKKFKKEEQQIMAWY